MEIVLDMKNMAIISGIVPTLPKLIMEEVHMVEGMEMEDMEDEMEMEDVEEKMEMEDKEEDGEQLPKLILSMPTMDPLWQM